MEEETHLSAFRPPAGPDDNVYSVLTSEVLATLGLERAEVLEYATRSAPGLCLFRIRLRVGGAVWQCDVIQPLEHSDDPPVLVRESLLKDLPL